MNELYLFQFVFMVIDSSDRERLSVAKDELYKMLNHEVSQILFIFLAIFFYVALFVYTIVQL